MKIRNGYLRRRNDKAWYCDSCQVFFRKIGKWLSKIGKPCCRYCLEAARLLYKLCHFPSTHGGSSKVQNRS